MYSIRVHFQNMQFQIQEKLNAETSNLLLSSSFLFPLTSLSESNQWSVLTNLIFPLYFCQIPLKTAMLTSMKNTVMNVTYRHDNDLIMFLQYFPI